MEKRISAESGKNATVLFAAAADGQRVPPFYVFPCQRMNYRLMINSPNESVVQTTGCMTAELFIEWMAHFVKYANPSEK